MQKCLQEQGSLSQTCQSSCAVSACSKHYSARSVTACMQLAELALYAIPTCMV
jgi:hypothetical protein